MSQHRVLTNK